MITGTRSKRSGRHIALGTALVAALLIEALDELVDGTKDAAFPLIRADLHLSYPQVGLLIAVPLLVGGLIELPLGVLAGYGARRNQLVLAGGVLFAASLGVVAFAGSFGVLLAGLVAFFPASGAFVSLTQAALMDADPPEELRSAQAEPSAGTGRRRESVLEPGEAVQERREAVLKPSEVVRDRREVVLKPSEVARDRREVVLKPSEVARDRREVVLKPSEVARDRREVVLKPSEVARDRREAMAESREAAQQQRMAAWNLAGSIGAVTGPVLLVAVLTVGGTWRSAYLLLAGLTGVAIAIAAVGGPARRAFSPSSTDQADADRAGPVHGNAGDRGEPGDRNKVEETADGLDDGDGERVTLLEALAAIRNGEVARWLILLEVIDLLLDVLTGYIGIYLVDVVHVSPADAALGVGIRLGGGLAGDALFVVVSRRVSGRAVLTVSAVAAAGLYPGVLAHALVRRQAGRARPAERRHRLLVSGRAGRAVRQPAWS